MMNKLMKNRAVIKARVEAKAAVNTARKRLPSTSILKR
jgi:hypothetical protein